MKATLCRRSTIFLFAVLSWAAAHAQPAIVSGHKLDQPAVEELRPRYLLMDLRGRAVSHEDFAGRFQLIAFGFVSCPDVCPTTLLVFKDILAALGDEARNLQPIFVTVDPARDTVEILREYTRAFDARILGLTGSPELVRRAADSFRVEYEQVREPGAAPNVYTMNHTAGAYLLGPDGSFLAKFPYAMSTPEIVDRLRSAMANGLAR